MSVEKVFEYNDKFGEFIEIQVNKEKPLYNILDSDKILLFVDHKHSRIWIWHGCNTTTKERFIAAKLAPNIRDRYGKGFKITAIDEGNELLDFNVMIGKAKENDYTKVQTGPIYEGTQEDTELLESLSKEKLLLLISGANPVPEGYKRIKVVINDDVFEFREYSKDYLGSKIKETKLIPLKEKFIDANYLSPEYKVRDVHFSEELKIKDILRKLDREQKRK